MTTPQASWPLNQVGTVTLDGAGNGTVQLRPDGPAEHWYPALASVKASSATTEASCKIYVGPQVADQFFVDATLSGSTGDATAAVSGYDVFRAGPLPSVWAVWAGGDPGAIATLVLSGQRDTGGGTGVAGRSGGGFSNPLVGGGGALVYPSIHSPKYSAGPPVTGWTINKDGSFSFGAGGSITGPLKIFNSHGAVIFEVEPSKDAWFLYADTGSAVQGALLVSAASANGTDDFGNTFEAGLAVYVTATAPGSAGTWSLDFSQLNSGLPSVTFKNLTSPQNIPPFIDAAGSGSAGVGSELALSSGIGVAASSAATLQLFDTVASGISATLIALNVAQANVFGFVLAVLASAGVSALGIEVTGDTNQRLLIDSNGKMSWGTGAAAADTTLARGGAAQLNLSGALQTIAAAAGNNAVLIQVSGDTGNRLRIDSNGALNWGSGSAATDTTLGRNAANQLITGGSLVFTGVATPSTPAAGDATLYATTNGTPAEVLPSGFQGELAASPGADFTHFTVTGTANAQFSKGWTIPAGDAEVGTTYRLTIIGSGTQAGTTQDSIKVQFSNGDAAATIGTGFAAAGAAFFFKAVLELSVITTGAAGTANFHTMFTAGTGFALGFTQAGAFNTGLALTLEAQAAWGTQGGISPTVTCFQSYFERIGP